jgi:hypothetical protein
VEEVKISLAVSHTPWRPERVKSLGRLLLGVDLEDCCAYREFTEKCHFSEWSAAMWNWSVATDATHCLFLQDDVRVAPEFMKILRSIITAVPDQIIGLEAVHPWGPFLANPEVSCRWYSTLDGIIGVGYVVPKQTLINFLFWRLNALQPGALKSVTEDSLIGLYSSERNMRIYHPCPTIIDHDLSMQSNFAALGNDSHPCRRPSVTWHDPFWEGKLDMKDPTFWLPENPIMGSEGRVPHLGRFYESTPSKMLRWIKDVDMKDVERVEQDVMRMVHNAGQ